MRIRLICVMLFAVLSISTLSVAESINFTMYDDEALLDLKADIQQEIVNRRIEKSAELPAGTYIAGKDIPIGDYIISVDDPAAFNRLFMVFPYDGANLREHHYLADKGSFKVTLSEGEVLKCEGKGIITVFTGITFE